MSIFGEIASLLGRGAGHVEEHEDIAVLQEFLASFGYLKQGHGKAGCFCEKTQRAVRRYQRYHGITIDGVAGPQTKGLMDAPRCGCPDRIQTNSVAEFNLRGCSYDTNHLTYMFENRPQDVSMATARAQIESAFAAWAEVTPLRFTEVSAFENPTFRIGWHRGEHGDGSSFDGRGRTIAHAFFPPPCGGRHAGAMHFDEAETFAIDPDDGIALRAVAIHEIGHLLGLSHSDDRNAIMFPTYDPDNLDLGDDDIAGIQTLYGAPPVNTPTALVLDADGAGSLTGRGEEQEFTAHLPARAALSIDGPDDADFDLYVKRGSRPTTSDWDLRAFTSSSDESLVIDPSGRPGNFHIVVRSFSGSGSYTLKLELV